MNTEQRYRERPRLASGFALGLLTGAVVGAGLAIWFSPRLAGELRDRATGSARDLRRRAAARYDRVGAAIVKAAGDATARAMDVRDDVADVVAHGAAEVERLARIAKIR